MYRYSLSTVYFLSVYDESIAIGDKNGTASIVTPSTRKGNIMNNLYDDEQFFKAYANMPRSKEGLNTAGIHQDWIYAENGTALHWPVDNYFFPGRRETFFLGQSVEKQHHTLTQILNTLIGTGFQIASVEEAMPPQEMMNIPGMTDEMRRPMMLLVKAVKP